MAFDSFANMIWFIITKKNVKLFLHCFLFLTIYSEGNSKISFSSDPKKKGVWYLSIFLWKKATNGLAKDLARGKMNQTLVVLRAKFNLHYTKHTRKNTKLKNTHFRKPLNLENPPPESRQGNYCKWCPTGACYNPPACKLQQDW